MRWWFLGVLSGCAGGGDDPADAGTDTDTGATSTGTEYRSIVPDFTFVDEEFEGARLTYYVPEDPRALLFAFHGTDGDISTVQQVEWIELYNLLAPHGYGFVLSQSVDRTQKVWDTTTDDPAENADWPRLSAIRDHLVATTGAEFETPIQCVGFSNGGNMAVVFASLALQSGWDFRGFSQHQGGMYTAQAGPGIFVSAENDELGLDRDRMLPNAEACTAAVGESCPHWEGNEIPLHPLWFSRMPYFTQDQSRYVFDELVGLEIVDPDGVRLWPVEDMEAAFDLYLQTADNINENWVPTALRVVWATHRFSSEYAEQEAGWLLARVR